MWGDEVSVQEGMAVALVPLMGGYKGRNSGDSETEGGTGEISKVIARQKQFPYEILSTSRNRCPYISHCTVEGL